MKAVNTNKPKILIVGSHPPPYGGIAVLVKETLNSRLKDKYDLIHCRTGSRDITVAQEETYIQSIIRLIYDYLSLIYLLVKHSPRVVNLYSPAFLGFWSKSILAIVSKLFGKKTVIHIHSAKFDSWYNNASQTKKWLIRFLLNRVDIIVIEGEIWKTFFKQIVPESKLVIIPNCVHLSNFKKTKKSKRENKISVLFPGSLCERKGVFDILKAVSLVVKEEKNIKFIFGGRSSNEEEIKILEIIKSQHLENYTAFIGEYTDKNKSEIYGSADIFILPSYAEGLPISMLDAMALGLPIISTRVGAIPEVIDDRVNGFLIEPGDYKALAKRILILTTDRNLREKMGKNNIEKIKKNYDFSIMVKNFDELQQRLLKENGK